MKTYSRSFLKVPGYFAAIGVVMFCLCNVKAEPLPPPPDRHELPPPPPPPDKRELPPPPPPDREVPPPPPPPDKRELPPPPPPPPKVLHFFFR